MAAQNHSGEIILDVHCECVYETSHKCHESEKDGVQNAAFSWA